MLNPRKLRPFNATVTTPVTKDRAQLWAMGFMRQGWMVCTPATPMHEGPLLNEPINDNGAKIVRLPRRLRAL